MIYRIFFGLSPRAISGAPRAAKANGERAAWLLLPILTLVWGGAWPAMKVALGYAGPFGFSAWRYGVGTIVAFGWLLLRRVPLDPPPWLPTIAIGVAQTAAFQSLAEWALVHGGAGKTSLLAYTMPFWVVLLAALWLHERLGPRRIACIVLAALGLFFVVRPWGGVGDPLSVLAAVASGLAWAIGIVVTKWTFERYPGVSATQLTAWQLLIGTILLIALALAVPERSIVFSAPYIGAVLFTGVLATGLGWIVWSFIVQHLPATVAGLTGLGVPIAGVLLSWALLAERPSAFEGLGMVLIGLALLGLNFAREPPRMKPKTNGG